MASIVTSSMRGASVSMLVQCAGVLLLLHTLLLLVGAQHVPQDSAVVPAGYANSRTRRHDILTTTTCEARCWSNRNKNTCIAACLSKGWTKRGSCPNLIQINTNVAHNTTVSPFYRPCLNECKRDSDCGGVAKCCRHHCGSTCQPALDLHNIIDLPDVPLDIQITARKKRALFIKWKAPPRENERVFYVLEERHRMIKFDNAIGEWSTCGRSTRTSVLLRSLIKPGRWYQFRIASVNANGTKGFSSPVTYIAQIGPRRPPAPEVTVGPLWLHNGTLRCEVAWTIKSELPIAKFKVFWSKRIYGVSALDSVLVLQHTVPGDIKKYIIPDLELNSMYFVQVQAVAQHGDELLRGDKSGYVLNTTNYQNLSIMATNTMIRMASKRARQIEDMQLDRLYWSREENDLKARIAWRANLRDGHNYNITWWATCKHDKDAHHRLTATTRHAHFDIYDLHFDCRYKVHVREMAYHARKPKASKEQRDAQRAWTYVTSVTFATPSCKDLQERYKRLQCKRRP